MAMKRCDMCFQEKPSLVPAFPGGEAVVCKACSYKVQQVVGFMVYHGAVIQIALPETATSKKTLGKDQT